MTEISPETLFDQGIIQPQLELLRANLARGSYPHYPAFHNRLFLEPTDDMTLSLAEAGPWQIDHHPNNPYQEAAPDPETQQRLVTRGLLLDAKGRPLHPWIKAMATDPSIGVVTGKGAYWHWGPNYTADNILLSNNHVLLVKRGDNGMWALPGGHIDPGEDALVAARRELKEETGLGLPVHNGRVTYRGPVVDPRVTANAWPETTAVLYDLADDLPDVQGLDDADDAAWFPLDIVRRGDVLFGSHRFLLDTALRMRG
jgi:8-oxo-dGTP pyrophosphatase MutT (NUDIX family)